MSINMKIDNTTNSSPNKGECITCEEVESYPPFHENMFDVEIAYATMKDEDYPFK